MPRHPVQIKLSPAQAEYLAEAIAEDIEHGDLTPAGRDRAHAVLAKVEHGLDKAVRACGHDCKCRQTPSAQRADADYRDALTDALTDGSAS